MMTLCVLEVNSGKNGASGWSSSSYFLSRGDVITKLAALGKLEATSMSKRQRSWTSFHMFVLWCISVSSGRTNQTDSDSSSLISLLRHYHPLHFTFLLHTRGGEGLMQMAALLVFPAVFNDITWHQVSFQVLGQTLGWLSVTLNHKIGWNVWITWNSDKDNVAPASCTSTKFMWVYSKLQQPAVNQAEGGKRASDKPPVRQTHSSFLSCPRGPSFQSSLPMDWAVSARYLEGPPWAGRSRRSAGRRCTGSELCCRPGRCTAPWEGKGGGRGLKKSWRWSWSRILCMHSRIAFLLKWSIFIRVLVTFSSEIILFRHLANWLNWLLVSSSHIQNQWLLCKL